MGQSRLHLPASSGMLPRPQPGWRSARPTAPGCFTAPLASGDWFANLSAPTAWFSPWKRRDSHTSRAAGFAAKEGGGWCCEPITVSRTLSIPTSIAAEDFHHVFRNRGQCVHSLARGNLPREQICSPYMQVWCAVPSAFDAYITTLTHIYAHVSILCVYVYMFTALHNPSLKMPFD